MRIAILLVFLAACGAPQHVRPTTGGIAGLARDQDTGDPVAKAEIRVRAQGQMKPFRTTTDEHGLFDIEMLAPGRYTLSATFAGQPLEVANITVRAGENSLVDLTFTLGRPDPIVIDYEGPKLGAINRYRPRNMANTVAMIEGTVNDSQTRQRVPGAVITAVSDGDAASTQQTISDDQGRYRFDGVTPGNYSISAYYSISGRGQIEIRRSDINVEGATAVVVPLWIEMTR